MERQYSLSQVKKGIFPEQILGSPEYTQLLGLSLNQAIYNKELPNCLQIKYTVQ